jgi:hypothetical protein
VDISLAMSKSQEDLSVYLQTVLANSKDSERP